MRLVVALGGNALMRRGEPATPDRQRRRLQRASLGLAALCRRHEVAITHGNGPQIGLLAAEATAAGGSAPGLDVLGAETEGLIGYELEQALRNRLSRQEVATLLTQVVVGARDPAFRRPTKPIGALYERAAVARLKRRHGWRFVADGKRFRRVVASPEPRRILGIDAVRCLIAAGFVVICAGGGGIPVVADRRGRLAGVSAVIDKDLAASKLALALDADELLLLTDVDAVHADWGKPTRRPIRSAAPSHLRRMRFEAGTMGPKVEAACRFVAATGRSARIGHLDQVVKMLAGRAGTLVAADAELSFRGR